MTTAPMSIEELRRRIASLRTDIAAQKSRVSRITAAIEPRQKALDRLQFDLATREAAAAPSNEH